MYPRRASPGTDRGKPAAHPVDRIAHSWSEVEIARIYHRPWFVQAPLVIAVCAISSQAWVRERDHFNAP